MNYQKLLDEKIIDRKLFLLNYYHLIELDELEVMLILQIELLIEKNIIITSNELTKKMKLTLKQIEYLIKSLLEKKAIAFSQNNRFPNIDTSNIYVMIIAKLMDEQQLLQHQQDQENKINIVKLIEEEFNRKLSGFEIDLIREWHENYSEELIIYALKEAVFNGIYNLKYMDKIIIEQDKIING